MNEQMRFFRNVIDAAAAGQDGAVTVLRQICRSSAEAAPPADIVKIAEFLFDLRTEAARRHVQGN